MKWVGAVLVALNALRLHAVEAYVGMAGLALLAVAIIAYSVSFVRRGARFWSRGAAMLGVSLVSLALLIRHAPAILTALLPLDPKTLADAAGATSVVERAGAFWVTIETVPKAEDDLPAAIGLAAHRAGQWLTSHSVVRLGRHDLVVTVVAKGPDQFGRQKSEDAGSLRWVNDDLRQVNWQGLTVDGLLALARIEAAPKRAMTGWRRWCANHYLAHGQTAFCLGAARAAIGFN